MARKAKHRISYVLPLADSTGGHRLGVNGLAVDAEQSILYSGGRDGVICAWDLHLPLGSQRPPSPTSPKPAAPATTLRQQVQGHTHWINSIVLAQHSEALVSASSDITVKIWRPAAEESLPPQTIGLHSDYVKTLAVPNASADWVASGGLDRKICLWDLNGAGQKLAIDVGQEEGGTGLRKEKGSVYALGVTNSILASGGPESIVRVWDPRTGKRVTKFVGHTDNIRDVLISEGGDTIMTASADQTVKVWSVTAGRCLYTLTMHDSSVWSLWSNHPRLQVFYSSDKSGLVAKTDTRGAVEMDESLSIAVCQEHEGVHKVISAGDYIWTATSRPSINRWIDVNTEDVEVQMPENFKMHRSSVATQRPRHHSYSNASAGPPLPGGPSTERRKKQIPFKHVLRLSNNAYFARDMETSAIFSVGGRRGTEQMDGELQVMQPYRSLPDFSIEGQNGLIKHVMLNDRRRVLTLDTAGEVMMWDLVKCGPIKSFGKRHLEDVAAEVNTMESVANWCAVDTRTGSLACVLEENYCFDAEVYADELELDDDIDFREDQRINLGKWVLRYLFSNLITEEIRRDNAFRKQLCVGQRMQRDNAPGNIQLPQKQINGWRADPSAPSIASTLRPTNGVHLPPTTPGLSIGFATPAIVSPPRSSMHAANHMPTMSEEGAPLEKRISNPSQARTSTDRNLDYFSTASSPNPGVISPSGFGRPAITPGGSQNGDPTPPGEPETGGKEKEGLFAKKFKMNMSFSMKKLTKASTNDNPKPAAVEEKDETDSDTRSAKTENSRTVEDNFLGAVQKIRYGYEDQITAHQQRPSQDGEGSDATIGDGRLDIACGITPSLANETPVLKPPLNTTILIQEDRPEAGGVADLFEGLVGNLGEMAERVEKVAPMWLGECLLRNQIPLKEIVKVSFVLEPWQGLLPSIAADGNNRLNANRMLRAKKILTYVAERIEPAPPPGEETPGDALRPEEYLELWCQNQVLPPTMTLATIRAHIWKGGGDVLLYYKANGRKDIRHAPVVDREAESRSGMP
ncbi:hypothetical protein LTR66_001217 [Elasticomyces elasticus]|nr:hypothetical protein LTR66_001217 [Elasticomyces elasticus]